MSPPVYRDAEAADEPLLRRMLAYAAAWRESGEVDVAIDSEPLLAAYVEDWPRPGDVGVVAEAEGRPVGAAWPALSLSVELENPALHLYERAGFVPTDVRPDAMTMRLDL